MAEEVTQDFDGRAQFQIDVIVDVRDFLGEESAQRQMSGKSDKIQGEIEALLNQGTYDYKISKENTWVESKDE